MTDQTLSFRSPFAGGTSVGVAIEVPGPFRTWLRELRERVEGEMAQEIIPPHVTIVPPTALPSYDLRPVEAHLERAAASVAPFQIELAGAGTFRPTSPVVFAALTRGAGQCAALQQAAVAGPLAQDLKFDYHPHVTVAQDVGEDGLELAEQALASFAASFAVSEFVLYERAPDERWNTIRTFELTGRSR